MDLILSDSFMSFSKCRGLPLLFQGQVVDACRPGVWEFMTVMKFQLEGFSVRDLRNLAREYRVFIEVVLTINIDGLVVVRILHDGDCFHIFSSHEGSEFAYGFDYSGDLVRVLVSGYSGAVKVEGIRDLPLPPDRFPIRVQILTEYADFRELRVSRVRGVSVKGVSSESLCPVVSVVAGSELDGDYPAVFKGQLKPFVVSD